MPTQVPGSMLVDADVVLESEIGQPNKVAGLDGTGKVPAAQLPAGTTGSLQYQGAWSATTNSPALASGVGTQGYYYVVGTAGATSLDGITDWKINDWAVYNGTAWEKVDNSERTNAEVKAAYEANADTNEFSDADQTKLAGVEAGATADQSGAEIKSAYEGQANAYTDAKDTKLSGIESGATADQSGAEIKAAYEAEANAYTDTKNTKLDGIEASANNYSHPNHTGEVTSTGDGATVIAANIVTNAKRATLAADRIRGRANGAGAGNTQDLTASQVRTILSADQVAINAQTGATYTFILTDAGKYVRGNRGTAQTFTVPPNSSVAYATGSKLHVRQAGAGQITLAEGSGVTINTPETLLIAKQHGTVTLVKVGTDEWDLMGNLEAA